MIKTLSAGFGIDMASPQVDDDQLLYLQNLILVSNEAVTDAFGVYEEDQDPVRLAESLKQVPCVCVCVGEVRCC